MPDTKYRKLIIWSLISLALGKFQVPPFLNLIENLTENITPADIQMSFGQIMINTNMGQSLIDVGKKFISSESSPLGENEKNLNRSYCSNTI